MCATQDRTTAFGVEYRRESGDTWSYVSRAPWPQLSPDGTPMMSLLAAGDVAFLQLSAQLDPPGRLLEQLRAILAAGRDPATVTLTNGVSGVRRVEIVVGEGEAAHVVATSAGSGFPPFTAAFGIPVAADDRADIDAALRGEPGHVHIAYDVETGHGPARIHADLADWARLG